MATCLATQAGAAAIAAPPRGPPAGYGLDVLEWTIPTFKGDVVLNGTVQRVIAQIAAAEHDFEAKLAKIDVEEVKRSSAKRSDEGLFKRGDVRCQVIGVCNVFTIEDGIAYLYRIGGNPSLGP